MKNIYTTHSDKETKELGKKLAQEIAPGTLICLRGDLGAGKTTLTQGLLEGLGAEKPYTSPTFVIMKQYDLSAPSMTGVERVYHADAYRVEAKDFAELGFAEWCADTKGIVILEWPERIAELLPRQKTEIFLEPLSEDKRNITLEGR